MGLSESRYPIDGKYVRKYKEGLSNPHDIITRDNIFVVTDKSNHRVVTLDKETLKVENTFDSTDRIYGQKNITTGKFDPYGVAYTGNSFVVTDLTNHCVVEYVGFVPKKVFGHDVLTRPTGIAVDIIRQEVYVADAEEDCIFVFDLNTKERDLKHKIGSPGSGEGELHKPWFMAINSKSYLVVAEFGNQRVQLFDPKTKSHFRMVNVKYDGKSWDCRGLALDENDNIYISVRYGWMRGISKERVVVYSSHIPGGEFKGHFGSLFDYIRGLTVTKKGNDTMVYVIDGARHSICAYKVLRKKTDEGESVNNDHAHFNMD